MSQVTLGIFTAHLRVQPHRAALDPHRPDRVVPQVSVSTAFLLVLTSVVMFIAFIHHITSSIQVTEVISSVGDSTARVIDRYYPVDPPAISDATGPGRRRPTCSSTSGTARSPTCTTPRSCNSPTTPTASSSCACATASSSPTDCRSPVSAARQGTIDPDRVQGCLLLATGHDLQVDPAYGFRQLVDIAARALSPGINDPTTAVECLDELHRLLRMLVQRHDPSPVLFDDDGAPRVRWQPQSIAYLVGLALVEPIHYGADAPAVARAHPRLPRRPRVVRPRRPPRPDPRHARDARRGRHGVSLGRRGVRKCRSRCPAQWGPWTSNRCRCCSRACCWGWPWGSSPPGWY